MQSEAERMLTWREEENRIRDFFDMMATIPVAYESLNGDIAALAYDVELLSKGILLNSSIEFGKLLAQKENKKLKMVYDDIKSADEQIRVLRSNMQTEEDANNVLTLERENKKRLLQLLRDCSEMADFTN